MPFWTVILLAGRMAIPQDLYDAAKVDGATGWRQSRPYQSAIACQLYLICTLLSTIFSLGDFNSVYFVTGGGPANSTHVLATLGIRDAFDLAQPRTWCGGGDVGVAVDDPTGHHFDAQTEDRRGAIMSVTTLGRVTVGTAGLAAGGASWRAGGPGWPRSRQ